MKFFGIEFGNGKKKESVESKSLGIAGEWKEPMVQMGVRGGRNSGSPTVVGTVQPSDTSALYGIGMSQRRISSHEYDKLYDLAIENHDVSFAISNIVELANTGLSNIQFDASVKPQDAAAMITELREAMNIWYDGGEAMLVNSILRQVGITGAVSGEAKPTTDLKGVGNVTLLSPKWVWFQYDASTADYKPFQQTLVGGYLDNSIIRPNNSYNYGYHPLSLRTYKYIAISRDEDSPYGIPPIFSAIQAICIENDMLGNLSAIVKRLGLFGFLQVVVNAPSRGRGTDGLAESDEAYVSRIQNYINSVEPEIEKGLSNGYVISAKQVDGKGIERKTDFNMTASTNDPSGAATLMELIMKIKSAGLKQDPVFLGKNFSTTESLAKVLIKKFAAQLTDYQRAAAQFIEHCCTLHLRLQGWKFKWVRVAFDPPILEDVKTQFDGLLSKFTYYKSLFDQGIIGQQQLSMYMGHETPFLDKPVQLEPQPMFEKAAVEQKAAEQFTASQKLETMQLSAESEKAFVRFSRSYNRDTMTNYKSATGFLVERLIDMVGSLNPISELSTVKELAEQSLILNWNTAFTQKQLGTTKTWIGSTYKFFRSDKSIFRGRRKNQIGSIIQEAKLSALDSAAIRNLEAADIYKMGSVLFNSSIIEQALQLIEKFYNDNELPFGNINPAKFRGEMSNLIERNSGEVIKITNTTVANARAIGSLFFLKQNDFESFELVSDKTIMCSNCKPQIGLVEDSFENVCNSIKTGKRDALMPPASLLSGSEWQMSNCFESCKCKILAIFFKKNE